MSADACERNGRYRYWTAAIEMASVGPEDRDLSLIAGPDLVPESQPKVLIVVELGGRSSTLE